MLKEQNAEFTYREYTKDPLTLAELKAVTRALSMKPSALLRKRDKAAVHLTGNESEAELMAAMAKHPTLLQRPIGLVGEGAKMRAVLGRPPEDLLSLL